MNKPDSLLSARFASLPPLLDVAALKANFGIAKTTAYLLASKGEIQSLTLGAPGKHGKRVFLTDSVVAHVEKRLQESRALKCGPEKSSSAA